MTQKITHRWMNLIDFFLEQPAISWESAGFPGNLRDFLGIRSRVGPSWAIQKIRAIEMVQGGPLSPVVSKAITSFIWGYKPNYRLKRLFVLVITPFNSYYGIHLVLFCKTRYI